MNNEDFLNELRNEFLDEALHFLRECEASYSRLGDPEKRPEELSKIFRMVHSLNSAGGSLGFRDLAEFAQCVEDFLAVLRTYPERVNSEVTDVLSKSGDLLKGRTLALRQPGNAPLWDAAPLVGNIQSYLAAWSIAAPTRIEPARPSAEPLADSHPSYYRNPTEKRPMSSEARKDGANSLTVDAERVEGVLEVVGELLLIQSQLMNSIRPPGPDAPIAQLVSRMEGTVRDLQDRTLALRMTPLKNLFSKIERIVQDLSIHLGKKIEFSTMGENIEMDRVIADGLSDPLIHLVRNSMDHGIETGSARTTAGKNPVGKIRLSADKKDGKIILQISDDGAGINREKVISKARKSSLIRSDQVLSDSQIFNLLFEPGFSTSDRVTDISGQGIGMDVVKMSVERWKGTIELHSAPGKGSTVTLTLPIATFLRDGILLKEDDESYVIPAEAVCAIIKQTEMNFVASQSGFPMARYREKTLGVLELREFIGRKPVTPASASRVYLCVETGDRTFFVGVDATGGRTQFVGKASKQSSNEIPGMTAGTLLADGRLALVLDPQSLGRHF
jgi:two-component system chemotaxis sensor kinase CheA